MDAVVRTALIARLRGYAARHYHECSSAYLPAVEAGIIDYYGVPAREVYYITKLGVTAGTLWEMQAMALMELAAPRVLPPNWTDRPRSVEWLSEVTRDDPALQELWARSVRIVTQAVAPLRARWQADLRADLDRAAAALRRDIQRRADRRACAMGIGMSARRGASASSRHQLRQETS